MEIKGEAGHIDSVLFHNTCRSVLSGWKKNMRILKKAEVYAKEGSYLQATQVLNQAQETAEDVEMYEPFGTVPDSV